jgi:hypothetical protein
MAMAVQKADSASTAAGMSMGGITIPAGGGNSSSRRLSSTCSQVTVQQTTYHQTNIYAWAPTVPYLVPGNATLTTVELRCPDGTAASSIGQVVVTLTSTPPATGTAGRQAFCVVFDEGSGEWSTEGVAWQSEASLTCVSTISNGTYTVAWGADVLGLAITTGDAGMDGGVIAIIAVCIVFCGVCAAVTGFAIVHRVYLRDQEAQRNQREAARNRAIEEEQNVQRDQQEAQERADALRAAGEGESSPSDDRPGQREILDMGPGLIVL